MQVLLRKSCILMCFLLGGLAPLAVWGQNKKLEAEKAPSAEPIQTHRVELESNTYDDDHTVIPLPDSTVLLLSTKRNPWFGKATFFLTRYDRQLKQMWQREYERQYGTDPDHHAVDRQQAFFLFSTSDSKKLLLYRVNLATGQEIITEHKLPTSSLQIQEIKALQGQLFLYTLQNLNLQMMLLDPAQEEPRILPAVFGTEEDLGDFRVDTLAKAVEFVVAETNGFRSRLQIKRLNAGGDVLGTYFLQPSLNAPNDNILQTGRLTPGDTLSKLVFGTYGYRTAQFARGLFSSDLSGKIKYHDFSKLRYFFEFLTPRRQKKLQEKFARQEALGKPLVLRYRLLLHPVLPHPNGYAVIGEVYYPQYRNGISASPYVYPSLPRQSNSRRMFDGYRFTHAIVCVFDPQGNLLWDNSYQLSNNTYPDLAPTVEAGVSADGHITLVYPKDDVLKFKTLRPNLSISNNIEVAVRTNVDTEKLASSEREGIVNWYGNTFIAFGFQRIRPQTGSARTVFVLQEMTFK